MRLAVGMMSGTSADGIDAVALGAPARGRMRVLAHYHQPYPSSLHAPLLEAGRESAALSSRAWAELDRAIGASYSAAGAALLNQLGPRQRKAVEVIGMHGQTVCHDPPRNSIQLGNPALLAASCGKPVVADFRRIDMALGGQGAPLVPPFHQAAFASPRDGTAVVNIGGIANLTLLPPTGVDAPLIGFDTGPGNTLMDAWIRKQRRLPFDEDGRWAGTGQPLPPLVNAWLQDPYFSAPPPKSTGLGQFHLDALFGRCPPPADARAEDVQASLLELTARTIATACHRQQPGRVLVCGGGARNGTLMRRLAELLAPVPLSATDRLGIPAEQVEAAAFAWLALRRLDHRSGTVASVTGALRDAPAGALYLPA